MADELHLDMSGVVDERTFHEYVSETLGFPGYYGRNLDALWDCITDDAQSSMPERLVVEGLAHLERRLPGLHDNLVDCLREYAREFPDREVVFRRHSLSEGGIDQDGGPR